MSAAPEELSIDKDAVSRSKPKLTDRPNKQIDPQIIKTKKPQTLRKRANRREIKVKNQNIQKMVCRLHNLKPVLIHFKWCDASKNQDTACSCSRLRISLLQFISPMARGREPGCHCWRCQEKLGRASNCWEWESSTRAIWAFGGDVWVHGEKIGGSYNHFLPCHDRSVHRLLRALVIFLQLSMWGVCIIKSWQKKSGLWYLCHLIQCWDTIMSLLCLLPVVKQQIYQ